MKLLAFLTFACHVIHNATCAFTPSTPVAIVSAFTPVTRNHHHHQSQKHQTQCISHNCNHNNRRNVQLQMSDIDPSDIPAPPITDVTPPITVPDIPVEAPIITVPDIPLPPSMTIPPIPPVDPVDLPIPPLNIPEIDYSVIALVAGQENYGFAVVALGEAIWSFSQAPSLSHAKVLVPAIIASILLVGVSGPMVTNASDPASIRLGLEIATGTSVFLGLSYVARLVSPFSPSAKEIAFLGLLVSVAGFFSFSQNLFVDGFVSLPTVDLPSLPSLSLPDVGLPSLPSLPKIELPGSDYNNLIGQ